MVRTPRTEKRPPCEAEQGGAATDQQTHMHAAASSSSASAFRAHHRFSLCVDGLFIEDEEVDVQGQLDMGDQIDPGEDFTGLVGQTVEIVNIGNDQDTCDGDVVLSGEVTSLE